MGGYGLAALSGLGQSIPKLAEGMIAGQKLDQHQQQLDELAAYRKQNQENQTTDIGQLFGVLGMPTPVGLTGRVPNAIATAAATKAQADMERKRVLGERENFARILEGSGRGAPGALTESLEDGSDPEAAAFLPRTQSTPSNQRMLTAASASRAGASPDPLMKLLFPDHEKPFAVGHSVYDPATRDFVSPPGGGTDPYTLGADQIRFNAKNEPVAQGVPKGDKPETPGAAYVAAVDALQAAEAKYPAGHPEIVRLQTRVNRLKPLAVQEGGFIGGPGGGGPLVQGNPKPPGEGQQDKISQLNALITLGRDLQGRWKADPTVKPGGLARLGEREFVGGFRPSDVIGQTQRDDQRRFMADATDLVATYRQIRSGLAVTNPEALRSMPLVPDNMGALSPQQLDALVAWAERNRSEIDRTLAAANRNTGPAPQAPSPPAPQGRTLRIRDPKTGRTGTMTLGPGEQPPAGLEVLPTNGVRG